METIALTIDGKKVSSPAGTSILETALHHGIKIPNLCYHPELKPYGACRMCLVEDEKNRSPRGSLRDSRCTGHDDSNSQPTDCQTSTQYRPPDDCGASGILHCLPTRATAANSDRFAAQLGVGETDLYQMPNFKPLEQANSIYHPGFEQMHPVRQMA